MGVGKLFLMTGLLVGCVAGQMMTDESFASLQTGMTVQEVEARVGKAWEIIPKPMGQMDAIYCERMRVDGVCREEKRYVLRYRDGRLLDKTRQIILPPPQGPGVTF